jgi:isopentenyldiphosphate isomerase
VSTAPVDNDMIDVLDDAGNVVGTATRTEMRAANLRHRTVFIVVVNAAGDLLAHQRADWKDVWPGAWDIAFGGVVEAGETWEVAAARELAEEAGIVGELVYLGEGAYADDFVTELARVYLVRHDGPFMFVDGEVVATEWVAPGDLRRWLDAHDICPDGVAIVLPRLDAP